AGREAADGAAFLAEVAAASGASMAVLSGEEEARYAFAAVAHGLDMGTDELLVADVGGRTTELTLGRGSDIVAAVSLPLGALALTETWLHGDPPAGDEIGRLTTAVDAALASVAVLA